MIEVIRQGDKLIGIYQLYTSAEKIVCTPSIKNYVIDKLLEELKKDDSSDLFTYEIIEVNESTSSDLFGINSEIIFEFVPNKEIIEEIKIVTERLQIGL